MIVLITGGASGLGNAITRKLAENKGNVVYFTFFKAEENARKITSEFSNTISIKCDFTDSKELEDFQSKIATIGIDVLVNNAYAGEAIKTHFHKIARQEFENDFQNNIVPTVRITQAAILAFRKKKQGKIITILTSFLTNTPPTGSAIYVANKAYLKKLTEVWANENVKYNITSNSVSPGFMLTDFTKETDERIVEQMISEHPLKKLLTTTEVAETVAFLASASAHLNNVDIVFNY